MISSFSVRGYDWLPPTNKVFLLAVFAHPDDEGIFFGGALPYYAGVLKLPAVLVSMTSGNTTLSNGPVREEELRASCWIEGVRYEPTFGHFQDVPSHTASNNPYTNTIDMTWDFWAGIGFKGDGSTVELGKAKAINFIAEQIRRYRPEVIITEDVRGEYGHDNHKAVAWAATNAFFVAADPNATATNLVGLAPWQARKLYLHLYPTNRLFHTYWERPFPELTNQTPHQLANRALLCDISVGQQPVTSVYPPPGWHPESPCEWWGLYASTVGLDTVLTTNVVVNGYPVPAGTAVGNFLEHLSASLPNHAPAFTASPLVVGPATAGEAYSGNTLAGAGFDWDLWAWNSAERLVFSKGSGPAWLNVAPDGSLSGTPGYDEAGTNSWVVRVTDSYGLFAETLLSVFVRQRLPGQEDLAGWWKLDDAPSSVTPQANSGTTALDSAPLEADGQANNGVSFGRSGARAWTGTAVQFNGASGKVEVPWFAALNPPVFTVALWANVTGGAGTYRSPLTSRDNAPQAGYLFYAGMNNLWQFWAGNGSGWNVLSGGAVVLNTWIHLAATYDGTTFCFYTNGVLAAAANASFQPNSAFPLRLGAGATEGSGAYWFPGLVDEVRVYRAALDPQRIFSLYATPSLVLGGLTRLGGGGAQLSGQGLPNQVCILLAAPSLAPTALWVPVSTNTAGSNGLVQLPDPWAANYPQRFYRALSY